MNFLQKNHSGKLLECRTVWTQIRTDRTFAKLTSRGYDLFCVYIDIVCWFPAKKSPVKSPLLFACWVIFHDFYCLLQHFQKKLLWEYDNECQNNSLDPDQVENFLGPDFGPNCLQKLSEDDTSRQRVK